MTDGIREKHYKELSKILTDEKYMGLYARDYMEAVLADGFGYMAEVIAEFERRSSENDPTLVAETDKGEKSNDSMDVIKMMQEACEYGIKKKELVNLIITKDGILVKASSSLSAMRQEIVTWELIRQSHVNAIIFGIDRVIRRLENE